MKFIHTSDWHLGSRRSILGPEAQPRYTSDAFSAIVRIGEIARQQGAEFVVVCGDIFESNLVDRKTVLKACEAMARAKVPFYLLPGNHDPMDVTSQYSSADFAKGRPENVHVVADSEPIAVAEGIELIGAPWSTKRALEDLCGRAVTGLEPKPGVKRILIGHGAVSELSMGRDDPSIIDLERLEAKIASGALSYVALGDRHSTLSFGKSGRVWCSGSLQATSFAEVDAGNILVVDLGEQVNVTKVPISDWRFVEESFVFNDDGDIKLLEEKLTRSEKKDTTVLSLDLSGTLSINGLGVLDNLISWSRDLFAAVDEGERKIVVNLDDEAMRSQLSGFTLATFERLSAMAKGDGPDAATAKDALSLLRRLSGGCGQ